MAKRKAESRLGKVVLASVGVVLVLYTLAGFLLVPWWLERNLPDQLAERLGWQARLESLSFNPYSFALELDAFAARDANDEPVLAFDRLQVNLSFLQLLRGIAGFEDIRLIEPEIRLDLLSDYSLNYARDWQRRNPQLAVTESASGASSGIPTKLYFGQVAIEGGALRFRDFTREAPAEFRIAPLNLELSDLATWRREGLESRYSLTAALGEQTIDWEGELSVTPLYSSGQLKLSGINQKTLSHFLSPYLPWQLRSASVTLESGYELAGGDRFELITSGGSLSIADLSLALAADDETPALAVGALDVQGIGFDLTAGQASVGMIVVEKPELTVQRLGGGELDWLASLPEATGSAAASQPGPGSSGFRWSVQGVEVTGGQVHWRDQLPETPAAVDLVNLSVTLGGLSHQLEDPVSYQVAAELQTGGRFTAAGQLTPAPFTFEAALTGKDLSLPVIQPYLARAANLEVRQGRLSFDGNLDLDEQDSPLTGTFSGTAEMHDFQGRLPGSNDDVVSWAALRLAPVEFNLNPARLEIGTITLQQPAVRVVRRADGVHNLQQIARATPAEPDEPSEPLAGAKTAEPGAPAFIFRIGDTVLEQGSIAYTDLTLSPPFSTDFNQLEGMVSGLSNVPPQQGRVSISGRLAGVAPVRFEGSLGALGSKEPSNLRLTMKDLALPVLSPYFGRYLGYTVDSGKLALDLEYRITGSQLEAANEVMLDRMALGASVASDQAIQAPVKLGLALLTDRNGVIDVNLPVSGDMSDPRFSIGQIVMRAFVNLLAKAAASPFSMLGSLADLAGFSSEELGRVGFVPGTVRLAEGEADQLSVLAEALQKRPDLLLNIRGAIAPEADALALLKARMKARGEEVTGDAWEQARAAWRKGEISLPPEALGALAASRGLAIRRLLENTYQVPDRQLFLLEPSRDAALDEQGHVTVQFTLDVR
ncbi:hypothetical protein C7H09_01995 [Marinobacter fuscus]|uniref:DUF748 domain-containing protein n=1 Tax=Marinobacter fuscus TaxID=2109942 RepID=A0A2T1KTG6_9GAMM|nr:DUF748 domain-containing protein [Marinobacter fuscus]PSF13406.1 hypothetical protein C7H09_01995 [Marinobacter fuscus]